jgi:hypothetical protein
MDSSRLINNLWLVHEILSHSEQEEISLFRRLYYELQNLETFSENIPHYRPHLISLLSDGLEQAVQSPERSILSVQTYSEPVLVRFLKQKHDDILLEWEVYLRGRTTGKGPDLFRTLEEAKFWLKQMAPLKYVDGAWLSHIHKINTPFASRRFTRILWQVLSEELGDGDLEKNHVFLYQKLIDDLKVDLPSGDSVDFVHERYGLNNLWVWKAAVGQLLISLFPNEFLPEILGFNMHFELITLSTMKATKELKELGIDNYYFLLHVCIDNSHSGHAAMAMKAVTKYMEHIEQTQSPEASLQAWKRIQAGYMLSEALGKEEKSKHTSFHTKYSKIIELFRGKAAASQMIHCANRAKIGPYSLVEWLAPRQWDCPVNQQKFLECLSNAKPWVVKGSSRKSLLIKELSWSGKMFGAFTQAETQILRQWIDHLGDDTKLYWEFTGREEVNQQELPAPSDAKILTATQGRQWCMDYSDIFLSTTTTATQLAMFTPQPSLEHGAISHMLLFLPLWFTHSCLLENLINVPFRTANPLAAAVLHILRAENGFSAETDGVTGIDELEKQGASSLIELGLEMANGTSQPVPESLEDIMIAEGGVSEFPRNMLSWSRDAVNNKVLLLGLCRAFLDLEEWVAESGILSFRSENWLRDIIKRKTDALDFCLVELSQDSHQYLTFIQGYQIGRFEIERCLDKCCADTA